MLGKGKVVLLSAHPTGSDGKAFIEKVIQKYAKELQVATQLEATQGTVVCPHVNKQGKPLWVIINMDGKGGGVKLPQSLRDAVTDKAISGDAINLAAYEWRALVAG